MRKSASAKSTSNKKPAVKSPLNELLMSIKSNLFTLLLISIYAILMLSVIRFGIPNVNQIFPDHMDEWHQLMTIRAVATHRTTTVEGASVTTMLYPMISIAYLGVFQLLKVIDVFSIHNATSNLPMQEKIFILLRFQTLLYGIGTLILIARIAKQRFHLSPTFTVFLFACTPIWVALSNYYKYDIALSFFITLSILVSFWFADSPSPKRAIVLGFFHALVFAIKISGPPSFFVCLLTVLIFASKKQNKFRLLAIATISYAITFFTLGIPDFFLGNGNYWGVIQNVVIDVPNSLGGWHLGMPAWQFILLRGYPLLYGKGYAFALYISVAVVGVLAVTQRHLIQSHKKIVFLVLGCMLYWVSVYRFGVLGLGNRVFVLHPFTTLFLSYCVTTLWRSTIGIKKTFLAVGIGLICLGQIAQTLSVFSTQWAGDPRRKASDWMLQNIPSTATVAYTNVPTYEMLPFVMSNDYAMSLVDPKAPQHFRYVGVADTTEAFPEYVVMSHVENGFLTNNQRQIKIWNELHRQGYVEVQSFFPYRWGSRFFGSINDYALVGPVQVASSIRIYRRPGIWQVE